MGRLYIETLTGPKIFKCRCCKVDSASYGDIVSKDFQGRYGRAYLFRNVVNIFLGPKEQRLLLSGLHTVNDIYCSSCQQILGWRYEKAYEESQKFKEGLYILEKERTLKEGKQIWFHLVARNGSFEHFFLVRIGRIDELREGMISNIPKFGR